MANNVDMRAVLKSSVERGTKFLSSCQREDGGFGWPNVPMSDAWSTAESALGLAAGGDQLGLSRALEWLRNAIQQDGGWASEAYRNKTGGASDTAATAYAIRVLAICGGPKDMRYIERGREWLVEHQRPDGGWGIWRADEGRSHVG